MNDFVISVSHVIYEACSIDGSTLIQLLLCSCVLSGMVWGTVCCWLPCPQPPLPRSWVTTSPLRPTPVTSTHAGCSQENFRSARMQLNIFIVVYCWKKRFECVSHLAHRLWILTCWKTSLNVACGTTRWRTSWLLIMVLSRYGITFKLIIFISKLLFIRIFYVKWTAQTSLILANIHNICNCEMRIIIIIEGFVHYIMIWHKSWACFKFSIPVLLLQHWNCRNSTGKHMNF